MPVGEIAATILAGALRFIAHVIVDGVLEILIQGPGYLVCRKFNKNIQPDGVLVVVVGITFWALVTTGGYFTYTFVSEAIAIDRCLDSGGAYNYQTKQCDRS